MMRAAVEKDGRADSRFLLTSLEQDYKDCLLTETSYPTTSVEASMSKIGASTDGDGGSYSYHGRNTYSFRKYRKTFHPDWQ